VSDLVAAFTRASGLVAAALVVAALFSGLLFSARATGQHRRPAWWLDLHNGLGGAALVATLAHVLAAVADHGTGLGVVAALVPGAASVSRAAVAWGVLATYLLAGTVLTTWPRRLRNRALWRTIHLGSVLAAGLSLLHAFEMGSDAATTLVQAAGVVAVATATYAVALRAADAVARNQGTVRR
jgi:hypothetical protein